MGEGYGEENLDFSDMPDDELLEIVNASPGRYRQAVVDGAKHELEERRTNHVREESSRQGTAGGVPPPASPENVPGGKLFSTEQVTLATFLGAPISGCLLLAQNYRALGQGASAWQPLVVGIASTVVLLLLAFFLPENFPNLALPAGSCVGMYYYAKQQQGAAIDSHLKAGGRKGSWGVTVALSLGCTVIILVLFVAVAIAFDIQTPEDEVNRPVVKVKVSQAGQIELNGTAVSLGQLRYALTKHKEADGVVWYYREGPTEPPPAVAEKVVGLITEAQLPVRMSSKPDFSDYIDADGKSVPSP